ncbi:MAG TPA: NADPH-dependent F420 reductase [Anaerolineae bacterium]|nr:NADPH-dependent F420 reductase [Anaerolineae bacterium]
MAQDTILTIAVLGGTGKEGSGLALRWADAGYAVIIGSREAARAKAAATHVNTKLERPDLVSGMTNTDAARACDIAVLSVPYSAHRPTLESVKPYLQGKILVDVTAPLNPDSPRRVFLPAGGSAGAEAQALLGDDVKVVSAFQNVGFGHLQELDHPIDCDVLVTGNDKDAKRQVIALAQAIDMAAFDAGPIENAVVAEALTSALININVRFKIKSSGIRITGIPR